MEIVAPTALIGLKVEFKWVGKTISEKAVPKRTEPQQAKADQYLRDAQDIALNNGADSELASLNKMASEVGVVLSFVEDPPLSGRRAISRDLEGWSSWP